MLAGAVFALVASVTLTGAPAEASDGLAHHRTAGSAAGHALDCEVTPAPGQGALIVRDGPSTTYGRWGLLQPGAFMRSACSGQVGGSYAACGGGNTWIEVYPSNSGYPKYIARRCVTLYQWS